MINFQLRGVRAYFICISVPVWSLPQSWSSLLSLLGVQKVVVIHWFWSIQCLIVVDTRISKMFLNASVAHWFDKNKPFFVRVLITLPYLLSVSLIFTYVTVLTNNIIMTHDDTRAFYRLSLVAQCFFIVEIILNLFRICSNFAYHVSMG
jgi:hypothetical protein